MSKRRDDAFVPYFAAGLIAAIAYLFLIGVIIAPLLR